MARTTRDSCETLFCRLAGFTRQQEDLLTECFAATLQSDPIAANEYWRQMTRNAPRLRSRRGSIHVTTQHSSKDRSARIDMRVTRQRRVLNVEHKLQAPEGHDQLPRYLTLPKVDSGFVAFVSADFRKVAKDVIKNTRYVRPSSRQDHFVWADLYSLVQRSANRGSQFGAATIALMKLLDLAPVHRIIGDVRDPKNDLALRDLWGPLIESLKRKGWRVQSGFGRNRKSEIWIEFGPSRTLKVVRLDPFSSPTSLVVRLKTESQAKRDQMLRRFNSNLGSIPARSAIGPLPLRLAPSSQGYDWAIDVKVGWSPLLARSSARNRQLTERTLRRFVEAVMDASVPDAV